MKIDTSNKWTMKLIGDADLTNGCAVIRSILFRALLILGGLFCCVVFAVVISFMLVGLVMYLFSPWFGTFDVDLSLSWLGNSWWAYFLRLGAGLGVVLLAVATVIGTVIGLFKLPNTRLFRRSKWRVGEFISTSAPVKVAKVIGEAAYNIAHKICPKVELVLPPLVQRMIDDQERIRITLPESDIQYGAITRIDVQTDCVMIWVKDPKGYSTYCCYYFSRCKFNEEVIVTLVDESETPI